MRSLKSNWNQQRVNWLNLPSDVTTNILNRIGTVDILENVQKVCTDWHKICKDPAMRRIINMNELVSSVEEFSNLDYICSLSPANKIFKHVVDRSQGQLVDLTLIYDFSGDRFQYAADRSGKLRHLGMLCLMFPRCLTTKALMKFPLLEELDLYLIDISKEEIETLGRYCPLLKTLKVNKAFYLHGIDIDGGFLMGSNEIAIAIGQNLVELRHLELIANKMTNIGLQAILDNCNYLDILDLRGCFNIDVKGDLGKRCSKQIKHLNLPYDPFEGCSCINEAVSESSDENIYDHLDDTELLILHDMTMTKIPS